MGSALLPHDHAGVWESVGEVADRSGMIEVDVSENDPVETANSCFVQPGQDVLERRGWSGFDQRGAGGRKAVNGGDAAPAMHKRVDGYDAIMIFDQGPDDTLAPSMLRAHLIMNPEARRVRPAVRRVVQAALEARFKLDATVTEARDAAIEVAAGAAEAGCDLVVAFGGDGLVNEVANGIAGTGVTLGVVPGGTMNVLARNLGIPRDPLEAADLILRKAGSDSPRQIRLGLANDRYFTFVCGCGFDADAAARAEDHKAGKRRFGELYFYGAALSTFFSSYLRREPHLRCEGGFPSAHGVLVIGLLARAYAYLAGRPVRLSRRPADGRLDLFILRRLRPFDLPRYALAAFATSDFGPEARVHESVEEYVVSADAPFPIQVDGEPLGSATRVHVRLSPHTLPVVV